MEIEKYIRLKQDKINIDDYLILKYLREGQEKRLISIKYIYDHICNMCERGLITEDNNGNYQILSVEMDKYFEEKTNWVKELYDEIEKLIETKIGKKNFKNPSGKMYKSAFPVFEQKLFNFFRKFGNQDIKKIRLALLQHCNEAIEGNNKFIQTQDYFILKQAHGGYQSELLNSLETCEEITEEIKKPINTKQLF